MPRKPLNAPISGSNMNSSAQKKEAVTYEATRNVSWCPKPTSDQTAYLVDLQRRLERVDQNALICGPRKQ